MPISDELFKINYTQMFDVIYPQPTGKITEKDGILRCDLTWNEAKAKPLVLHDIYKHAMERGKIIWFQEGDPYLGSKPFNIYWVGIENLLGTAAGPSIVVIVNGQKSERIKKKWSAKLSALFFGYPVSIIWEEDAQ